MSRKNEFLTSLGLNPKGRYLFHGTSPEAADSIQRDGFQVGAPERNGSSAGSGVYLTRDPDEAATFGPEVLAVHLGKTKIDRDAYYDAMNERISSKTDISADTAMKRVLRRSGAHAFTDPDDPHTIVVDPQHLKVHGRRNLSQQFEESQ